MDENVPSILVKIQQTDQLVEVFVDELPDDVHDLLDLLRAEVAPLDIWHRFALEYYRQGRKDAFCEILKEAKVGFDFFEQKKLSAKEREAFNDARLKIINALAADLIFDLAEVRSGDKDRYSTIRTEILTYFSAADRINPEFHLTWACKSLFEMINGTGDEFIDRAEYWAKMLLKDEARNVPGLLVKAAAHFHRAERVGQDETPEQQAAAVAAAAASAKAANGKRADGSAVAAVDVVAKEKDEQRRKEYEHALKYYESVLRSSPNCHPSVRLGLGLCCSRLGQHARARAAFNRVLDLDPHHVEATVGLTLLDMAAIPRHAPDRAARQAQAAKRLMKLRGPSNTGPAHSTSPMVLNHAANYAFWRFLKLEHATATATRGSAEIIVHLANPARSSTSPSPRKRNKDSSAGNGNEKEDGSEPLGAAMMDEGQDGDQDQEDQNNNNDDDGGDGAASRALPEHVVAGVPVRLGHFTGSAGAASKKDAETDKGWFEAVILDPVERSASRSSGYTLTLKLSEPWDRDSTSGLLVRCPNYKQVETDAGSAYWYSKNKAVKAESYYLLGRADHARRNYNNAEKYYKGAVHLCSTFAPAHFGLAQMHIHNREFGKAIGSLQEAVKGCPEAGEALLLLGKLHEQQAAHHRGRKESVKAAAQTRKALGYLERAKALDPACADVWLTRGQALQGDSAQKAEALDSYTRGVALAVAQAQAKHRAVAGPPPPPLPPVAGGGDASSEEAAVAVAAAAAAAAAAATTKAREDMDEGARRAGVASVGCGVWANLGCLQHEHGKRGAARRSYLNALEADSMQYEAGLDPEAPRPKRTLYMVESSNSPFWQWQPLPGTVSADAGASVLATTEDLQPFLSANVHLRLRPPQVIPTLSAKASNSSSTSSSSSAHDTAMEMASSSSSSTSTSVSGALPVFKAGGGGGSVGFANGACPNLSFGNLRVDVHPEEPISESSVPLRAHLPFALENCQVDVKVVKLPLLPTNVTTAFNLACLHESCGEFAAAAELYRAILAKFPGYKDATLRLACVHQVNGAHHKALGYLERAAKQSAKDPAPSAMAGALHLAVHHATGKTSRLEAAKQSFEKIQKMDKRLEKDPYAMLGVANIYFGNLHRTAPDSYLKELGWAKAMYDLALKADPGCAYAANGLGMVLAEEGHLSQAKSIFERVKTATAGASSSSSSSSTGAVSTDGSSSKGDSSSYHHVDHALAAAGAAEAAQGGSAGMTLPDATVNLGHLLVIEERYLEAVKNYEAVLRKPPHWGHDGELLLLAANAHFCDGRHAECLRTLSRALRGKPGDASLWHNVAVAQYSFAEELFNKHLRPDCAAGDVVADITAAQRFVESAKAIFEALRNNMLASSSSGEGDDAASAGAAAGMGHDEGSSSSSSSANNSSSASGSGSANTCAWGLKLKTLGVDEKKLADLLSLCDQALTSAPERLAASQRYAAQLAQHRAAREAAAKEAADREAEAVAARESDAQAARLQAAERARLKQQQLAELRTAQAQASSGMREDGQPEDGGGTRGKGKGAKAKRDAALMNAQAYDDGDDDDDAAAAARPVVDFGSSDEEADVAAPAAPAASALGLNDSDDDDEEEANNAAAPAAGAATSTSTKRPAPTKGEGLGLESSDDDDEGGGKLAAPNNANDDDDESAAPRAAKRLKKKAVADLSDDSDNEFDTGGGEGSSSSSKQQGGEQQQGEEGESGATAPAAGLAAASDLGLDDSDDEADVPSADAMEDAA